MCQQHLAQTNAGTFTTYIGDTKFAVEKFEIKKLTDDSELFTSKVSSQTNNTFTLKLSKNRPKVWSMKTGGNEVLTASFTNNEVKIKITGRPEKVLQAHIDVVLENLVWVNYTAFLSQYNPKKGGVQKFTALLPSQAVVFDISLEKLGLTTRKIRNKTFKLNEFRSITTKSNLIVNILTDENNDPVFFNIPSQQIIVVRNGFESLHKSETATTAPQKSFSGEFTEEEVTFNNSKLKLFGTLTLPKDASQKHPAVVIITGSGPQDRNGKNTLNIYKQIAENLSRAGIAVLRIDDRGVGKSTMSVGTNTSYRDLINDTVAAFDYLYKRKDIDQTKIALLGHSEGSETALTIASENKRVAAIMLLAGSSRPLNEVVLEQEIYQRSIQETITSSDKTKMIPISRVLTNRFKASIKPENRNNPKLAWFREHANSNPSLIAQKVSQPVLILQGERDSLVLSYHAIELSKALVKNGNKNVSLRVFPNLTHFFTPIGKGTPIVSKDLFKTLQNWAYNTLSSK